MALLVLPVQAETQPPAKVEVAAKADAKAADPPVPFVCPALGPPVIRLDHPRPPPAWWMG
jgi:hypothetical protein